MLLLAVAQALATSAAHHVATPMPVNPVLHSPLPVNVKVMPGPDAVALTTLQVATWTLRASIVSIGVGVVAIGVAIYDAWNNRRQLKLVLRQPNLTVDVSVIKAVHQKDGANSYYEARVKFRVTNLESGTYAADNVTVRLHFPESIVPTEEWKKEEEQRYRASVADALTSEAPIIPQTENPRRFISTARLAETTVENGYRTVTFYDKNGMQLLPDTRSSVSEVLFLRIPDTAMEVEWKALSVQGNFPKKGRGKINLVTAAKEKLSGRKGTQSSSNATSP